MIQTIPPLQRGDRIGFVTPAGPVRYDKIAPALARLEGLGFQCELGKHALEDHGLVSALPQDRINDLMDFLHLLHRPSHHYR